MQELQTLVQPLLQLCLKAGDAICDHYRAPEAAEFETKSDDSPLTKADLASHVILDVGLTAIAADWPILSEESAKIDYSERRAWQRYWLVDPLDGTKEFLARTGEFTINIALVDGHFPILGLLYLPLTQVAYVGIPGAGAHRYRRLADGSWEVTELVVRALAPGTALTVLASRRHGGPQLEQCLNWLRSEWGEIERVNSGSALKFCQMVEGEGDVYPRFAPCCEWDTAAGQALLEATGGALLGLDGEPLRYNASDSLLNPDFIAFAQSGHALWQRLMAGYR